MFAGDVNTPSTAGGRYSNGYTRPYCGRPAQLASGSKPRLGKAHRPKSAALSAAAWLQPPHRPSRAVGTDLPVTKAQSAFLSSYGLPRVDAVAVGTDNVDHLRELTEALSYEVDENVVREYRQLLKARQPA